MRFARIRSAFLRKVSTTALCCFLAVTSFTGCDITVSKSPPAGYVPPTPVDKSKLVPFPDYIHWNQFPVGTKIVKKKEVTNESGTVHVTSTITITAKSSERIITESQVTVKRPDGVVQENPEMELDYPAMFQLPEGLTAEQFALPSLKAKETGEETIEVAGRQLKCKIYEWEEVNEAGPMTVKLYRSEQAPGRTVREETKIKSTTDVTLEELVEISIPEDAEASKEATSGA